MYFSWPWWEHTFTTSKRKGVGGLEFVTWLWIYCFEAKDLFSSLRMVGWVVGQKKGAFFVNVMNRWLLWGNGKWSGAWQTLKTNRIKLTFHPEIYSIFTFWKGSGNNFSITLCVSFSSKMFLCYIYQLTKFHCLIAFTSCKDVIQD